MKTLIGLVVISMLLTLWAPSARPQIISTSLPTADAGAKKPPISAHLMVSPVGVWDYKEVWLGPTFGDASGSITPIGTVGHSPNSQILAACEIAVPLGGKRWAATLGGWYNKVGDANYDFDGQVYYEPSTGTPVLVPFTASIPISIAILEGHVGLFYGPFGLQVGVVRTSVESNGDFLGTTVDGDPAGDFPQLAPFEATTMDWTYYGVYKKAFKRWGLSVGLGAYAKQGITEDAPLRFGDDQMVASGFLTGNVEVFKRVSVDASFWYIGETEEVGTFSGLTSTTPSDAQSRMTLGLGYSF